MPRTPCACYKPLMGSTDLIAGALGIAILVPLLFKGIAAFCFIWPAVPLISGVAFALWVLPKR